MTCEAKSELRLFLCGELRLVYPAAVIVSVSSSILAKCKLVECPFKIHSAPISEVTWLEMVEQRTGLR